MHQTQKTLYVVAMCSTVSRLDTLVQETRGLGGGLGGGKCFLMPLKDNCKIVSSILSLCSADPSPG